MKSREAQTVVIDRTDIGANKEPQKGFRYNTGGYMGDAENMYQEPLPESYCLGCGDEFKPGKNTDFCVPCLCGTRETALTII